MYIDVDKRGLFSIMEVSATEADLIAAALLDLGYNKLISQLKSINHESSTSNPDQLRLDDGSSEKKL